MGASIASIVWIVIIPWRKLARVRELEANENTDEV